MNVKRIMLATDFSHTSDEALAFAVSLARSEGAKLDLVHVHEHTLTDTGFGGYAIDERKESEEAEAELKRLAESLAVGADHHLLHGEPAEQLVQHAQKSGAEMIVIGTHGRRGVSRLLMGSVAEAVVRGAHCPVMTFKHAKHHESDDVTASSTAGQN